MMKHYSKFSKETHGEWFEEDAVFTYDTESCDKIVVEGEPKEVYVYLSGLACSTSEQALWGNTCLDVLEVFKTIMKETGRNEFQILVHNLKWDYDFLRYELEHQGNSETVDTVKDRRKVRNKDTQKMTRTVVAKKEDVYSCNVMFNDCILKKTKRINKETKKQQRVTVEMPLTLKFSCTAKRLPQTLGNIAKKVVDVSDERRKIEGYDYDTNRQRYTHEPTKEELEYLYNDVYIVKEFYNQFMKKYNFTGLTASAQAFNFYLEETYHNGSNSKNYKEFVQHFPTFRQDHFHNVYGNISYRGGWTNGNRNHKGNVVKLPWFGTSIDINSSYPSVVANKPLPYGTPTYRKGTYQAKKNEMNLLAVSFDAWDMKDERNPFGEFQRGEMISFVDGKRVKVGTNSEYMTSNIVNGEIDYEIGLATHIGNHVNTNYHLPNARGKYVFHVWEFELLDMLKNMNLYLAERDEYEDGTFSPPSRYDYEIGYHIEHTITYPCEVGYFKVPTELCMKGKKEGKETKNSCMESFFKLMANSFYGKMGSKPFREVCKDEYNQRGILCRTSVKEDSEGNNIEWEYEDEKTYYVSYASCVTAWARTNLRQRLYEIGFDNVLYFDTDSLYTTLTKEELEQTSVPLHDTDLGAWKIEKQYSRFKWIAPKKYILEDNKNEITAKCLGLPIEAKENITFETFHIGAEIPGGKKKEKVIGGSRLTPSPYKIKEFD